MNKLGYIMIVASVIVINGCDDDDDKSTVSDADKNFVFNATAANRAEIELGQLASERGENDEVKQFGSHMMTEHTTSLNELVGIADKKAISIPGEPDDEHKQLKQRLMGLTGMSFDTAYMNSQVKDHEKVINMFEQESSTTDDSVLKDYVTKTMPHLTEHLATAKSVQNHLTQQMSSGRKPD